MAGDPAQEAEDLGVLAPDGVIVIAGERITVRRFRFLEGMQLEQECQSLLGDLAKALNVETGPGGDEDPVMAKEAAAAAFDGADYGAVMAVFARHQTELLRLQEVSTGKSADWIAALDDENGFDLLMTFWGVNHPFFVRRVMMHIIQARLSGKTSAPPASPPS